MADIQNVLKGLSGQFDASAAAGLDITFQFDISDGEAFYIHVHDSRYDVTDGTHDDPSVTLIADTETFVGIMTGEINGMQAFMTGKLRTEGNMMLATKLGDLFKV